MLILALAALLVGWVGQLLLLDESSRGLSGWGLLLLAVALFIGLGQWARRNSEPPSLSEMSHPIIAFVRSSPLALVLLCAGLASSGAAFWLNTQADMRPWPSLLAWLAGIGLFLGGAWRCGAYRPPPPPPTSRTADPDDTPRPRTTDTPHSSSTASPGQPVGVGRTVLSWDAQTPRGEGGRQVRVWGDPATRPAPGGGRPEPRKRSLSHGEPARDWIANAEPGPVARWEVVALVVLVVLAFLVRFINVAAIPNNISGDEGEMGMVAREVLSGALDDPFATHWLSHPTLWFFLQALSLHLFGDDIGGLRMLSVLIGTATVPMLYLFARPLYGRPTALIAALLLACFHLHVHYSRYALNNIADPLFGLICFAALFYGFRKRSPVGFALAGVALGVALHFYMGTRLFLVLVVLLLLHQLLFNRRYLMGLRWHVLLLVVGFFVGFGPLLHYYTEHPDKFNERIRLVGYLEGSWFREKRANGQSELEILAYQFKNAYGAFTFVPERSPQYHPGIPLLSAVSAVLFVLGLALVLSRWKALDTWLVLVWIGSAPFFGGVLLANPPESGRYVTTAPALCLVVVLALTHLARLLHWSLALPMQRLWRIPAGVVVGLALWNMWFYFNEFGPHPNFSGTDTSNQVGIYMEQQPSNTFVYYFGAPKIFLRHGPIRFLAADVPGAEVLEPIHTTTDLPPVPRYRRPVFIFLPHREGELEVVREAYPDGTLHTIRDKTGLKTLFLAYEPHEEQQPPEERQ